MAHASTIRGESAVRKRSSEPRSPTSPASRARAHGESCAARLGIASLAILLLALGWSLGESPLGASRLSLLLVGAAFGLAALTAFPRARFVSAASAHGAAPTIIGQYMLGNKIGEGRPASAAALRAQVLPFAVAWTEQRDSGFEPGEPVGSSESARPASGWQLSVPRAVGARGDLCLSACS